MKLSTDVKTHMLTVFLSSGEKKQIALNKEEAANVFKQIEDKTQHAIMFGSSLQSFSKYKAELDEIDPGDFSQFKACLPKNQREYLKKREEEMKITIGRGISNIEHAQMILKRAKEKGLI